MDDQFYMRKAIEVALEARKNGNQPFGAILVKQDKIVMTGENKINNDNDPTYHAEIGLISKYCFENKISDLTEYTLYSSCEPCVMCSGAMVWSSVGRLVYSVSYEQFAKISGSNIMISCNEVFEKSPNQPKVVANIINEEGLKVFEGFKF
ncbi:nucleoside deaminase [Chengkuizengella sediminis]|uniref:nucleoside deaminase n=1 Tax=Chengkuizengella sediminis TaxID=1885917 RepID=UPI00138A38A4|nr:nucleoside deaminase [Chengkuizengella sediminis]NDI36406.1 nucleoside deaminase [Chengkuizengella sediminis]